MEASDLRRQLDTVNTSLFFLLIIIASVLLSYTATVRQREAVCLALQGEDELAAKAGDVYTIRKGAGALVLGALGYFLCLAVSLLEQSNTGVSQRSAQANLWASILVLSAAIVRFRDLNETHRQTLIQETGNLADTQIEN